MDPNETLKNIRKLSDEIFDIDESDEFLPTTEEVVGLACDLAYLVQYLDGWIKKGGFLPDDWIVPLSMRVRKDESTTVRKD